MTKGERIREMLASGMSHRDIRKALPVSSATVSYHARKMGMAKRERPTYDWTAVQADVDSGMHIREMKQKYGFASATYSYAVANGRITPRKRLFMMTLCELERVYAGIRAGQNVRRLFKAALVAEGAVKNCCSECGVEKWRGKRITFDLDHEDGDQTNNDRRNLRLLCPNCHSQTPTWRGRNKRRYV